MRIKGDVKKTDARESLQIVYVILCKPKCDTLILLSVGGNTDLAKYA